MITKIPRQEFEQRQAEVQRRLKAQGLDALLAHSDEAEFSNVRYLSDYWPIFESAGVLISAEGKPLLFVGPESETFARDHGVIPDIRKILCYRESAEPDYPDIAGDPLEKIFAAANGGRGIKRLGIAGYTVMPVAVHDAVRAALPPGAEIVKADDLLCQLRMIKSENEIALLRRGFRIAERAVQEVLERIKPGLTELQVVGIAQEALYRHGAEYEAHPLYVLSGINTTHAIGRPRPKKIAKGELVQLDIGARCGGYSPSIGLPICMGKMKPAMRDLVSFGLEAHLKTMEWMKAGVPAGQVATNFFDYVRRRGYGDNLLYGPCHGLGLTEVERPWMETSSTYSLQANMTFQVDTFLQRPEYGLRWETGVRITAQGVDVLSKRFRDIVEIL